MERKDSNSYRLKTASIWGYPPRRFFRFLNRIEREGLPKTLAVLGCGDGRYVVPAAKRGFEVLAIERDEAALFDTDGLVNRLKQEGVTELVTVENQDFFMYHPRQVYSGVFTSGSIHYIENSKYSLAQVTHGIKKYTVGKGWLLLEYIYPTENRDPSRHYVHGSQLAQYFNSSEWRITSNKRKTYIEESNPRSDHIHNITWGRLYAQRKPTFFQ